jgi:hypothetical protein
MKDMTMLKTEYERCLRNILQSSEYITNMTMDRDIDKIDLYRTFLNQMVDRAVQLKKLINYE